jgi:hypothetical protein
VKSDFVVYRSSNLVKHSVMLNEFEGFDKIFELVNGVPQNGKFPKGAHYTMDPDHPHNTVFTDSLHNLDGLIVASQRLREFFEARKSKCLEYLPVGIKDHKGKLAKRDYSIVHTIAPVDCLDDAKSHVKFSRIVKTKIRSVKKLVLNPSKLDLERDLFRLDRFFSVVMVRRDVAEAIDKEGFTGMRWVEPADFPED